MTFGCSYSPRYTVGVLASQKQHEKNGKWKMENGQPVATSMMSIEQDDEDTSNLWQPQSASCGNYQWDR